MATAAMDWVSKGHHAATKVARKVGWLSIGLGVTELVAPRAFARVTGISRGHLETRLNGVRKVAAGVGILRQPVRAVGSVTQLGGNLIALAKLRNAGLLSEPREPKRGRRVLTVAAIAGGTVVGAICVKKLTGSNGHRARSIRHSASASINSTREQCYSYWHDPQNLPNFFKHLKTVRSIGDGRAEWVAEAPDGKEMSWTMEVTEDVPNQQIAWRSVGGGAFAQMGSVRFEPIGAGKGTIVRVHMQHEIPAGGTWFAKLLGSDPGLFLRKSLLRFKQLIETGEIATIEGQPAGRAENTMWLDRTARI